MRSIALALLLLAPTALGQSLAEIYPPDYKPSPCAPHVCQSYQRSEIVEYGAALRRFNMQFEWINAHWEELTKAFEPLCARIGNCLTIPGNDWLFCSTFMRPHFLATADRYPKGTNDFEQWTMAATMYYVGLGDAIRKGPKGAQECMAAQPTATETRKLEAWIVPEKIGPGYDGNFKVYTLDAERRVPVMAKISVEGQRLRPADDSPNGRPLSYYNIPWAITFNEVPNADGHRDLVAPNVVVETSGYETLKLPMPVVVPKVIVEMQPATLQAGAKNQLVVSARDADTGEAVELRVMAGRRVVGNTNKPLELDLPAGQKRPEIWVTSLFNRYSDVVVAKGD